MTIYASGYLAEIWRGSIQAVAEAAMGGVGICSR